MPKKEAILYARRSISSNWEERAVFLLSITRMFVVSVRRSSSFSVCLGKAALVEPRREKTGFLHMRKQRRRSASR